jgi:hypothetical protein
MIEECGKCGKCWGYNDPSACICSKKKQAINKIKRTEWKFYIFCFPIFKLRRETMNTDDD